MQVKGLILFAVTLATVWITQPPPTPWITVVSMIRNEGRILPRFLHSAHFVTPHIFFCDTGSTDNTLEQIKPYLVVQRPWTGRFDTSRNECLQALLQNVTTPYVLLLDADHQVEIINLFSKPQYQVNTLEMGGYRMPYLIATDTLRRNCSYVGWTHEYLDCKESTYGPYHGIRLQHHGDGGNRPEKFQRDLDLLERAYKEEGDPTLRVRYGFYLAR